jgi:hypothetical protein
MRVASASLVTGERLLVAEDGELLRPVAYDFGAASWRLESKPPFGRQEALLARPFEPLSLVAPGPRITAPDGWAARHREFHVKPSTVLAPPDGTSLEDIGSIVYRLQVGMVFAPVPRAAGRQALRRSLIGVHLVIELVSCRGFTLGWEGPRWHLRYAEGLSFDGACSATEWLLTGDELEDEPVVVEHDGGETSLVWPELLEFAGFVNQYLDLGPHTMLLAGWPLGPSIELEDGVPVLRLDGPRGAPGSAIWAKHPRLGHVERVIGPASP